MRPTAVVGVCWETSLVITKLDFLDHSCHMPPKCQILSADTQTHLYPALPFSLFQEVEAWKLYGPESLAAVGCS